MTDSARPGRLLCGGQAAAGTLNARSGPAAAAVPARGKTVPARAKRYSGDLPQRAEEASPSPVYGAALLMRFGFTPIRGSNPRASARS